MGILGDRDLRVRQAGMDPVEAIYRASQAFPQREVYGLASQMRRAAVSIPPNIAEGHAKESSKDYLRHISMAQGSLAERQTQVEIAGRLEYLNGDQSSGLTGFDRALARQLYALRNRLLRKDELSPDPRAYFKNSQVISFRPLMLEETCRDGA